MKPIQTSSTKLRKINAISSSVNTLRLLKSKPKNFNMKSRPRIMSKTRDQTNFRRAMLSFLSKNINIYTNSKRYPKRASL